MFPVIVIGFVAIVGISLALILSSIDEQQELSEINYSMNQNQMEQINESVGIKSAIHSTNGSVYGVSFENVLNEEISIIQIRVYDDSGNFVKSFMMNDTISGNTRMNLNIPLELQEMMNP